MSLPIIIMYRGKKQTVENVVLDTGAARTVISPDAVADLGIGLGPGDPIIAAYGIGGRQYAFVKQVDGVRFGSFSVIPCKIDFGLVDPEGKINGLLGLDLLMKVGAVIDLKNLMLSAGL
ncbi:MAG: retropepsin-like aspartic protease [Bacillota bacterium]